MNLDAMLTLCDVINCNLLLIDLPISLTFNFGLSRLWIFNEGEKILVCNSSDYPTFKILWEWKLKGRAKKLCGARGSLWQCLNNLDLVNAFNQDKRLQKAILFQSRKSIPSPLRSIPPFYRGPSHLQQVLNL